jgi:hypothetical protein
MQVEMMDDETQTDISLPVTATITWQIDNSGGVQ